ncbi:hypothetical protein FH972_001836 [Carpinus fangiana]|uniref:Bulb-type lectin domain-containing protein n=1 Tax=Carpinus fangiana TaxID=176857 RepID=A0A5N6QFD7_9ROSI|nr:hypothetical protein FH972_001836 [Carpinus fangiana]
MEKLSPPQKEGLHWDSLLPAEALATKVSSGYGITSGMNEQLYGLRIETIHYSTIPPEALLELQKMATSSCLILHKKNIGLQGARSVESLWLWESFKNPTDTFLLGMKMGTHLTLTSWKGYGDPGSGIFTFKLDQEGDGHYVISKVPVVYWKSRKLSNFVGSDPMRYAIAGLLSNFSTSVNYSMYNSSLNKSSKLIPDYSSTRLVMDYSTGQLQYLAWDNDHWNLTCMCQKTTVAFIMLVGSLAAAILRTP